MSITLSTLSRLSAVSLSLYFSSGSVMSTTKNELSPEELDEVLLASVSSHAEIIGNVAISWNMCHVMVFSLFYMLSGMSWDRAAAVFFALKADVQQREITMALALQLPKAKSPRKKITAALGRLNELAAERNATIHTMWSVSEEQLRLIPTPGLIHNPKLNQNNPQVQFTLLDRELAKLHSLLLKATLAMAAYGPLPNTDAGQPRDPSANGSASARPSSPKTPRRQRRSSDGTA